jgi:hypothetical protein
MAPCCHALPLPPQNAAIIGINSTGILEMMNTRVGVGGVNSVNSVDGVNTRVGVGGVNSVDGVDGVNGLGWCNVGRGVRDLVSYLQRVCEWNPKPCVPNPRMTPNFLLFFQALQMFGYRRGELDGKNISMLMPQPFSQRHNTFLKNYITTGKVTVLKLKGKKNKKGFGAALGRQPFSQRRNTFLGHEYVK